MIIEFWDWVAIFIGWAVTGMGFWYLGFKAGEWEEKCHKFKNFVSTEDNEIRDYNSKQKPGKGR